MKLTTDIFSEFDQVWALVTAGTPDNFNTMTISWGGMGTLWGKPVATVYIRTSRYTHEFVDANEYFTISFYPEEYKKVLGVLGSKSGREMDKMHSSGLTPKYLDKGITFEEAKYTLFFISHGGKLILVRRRSIIPEHRTQRKSSKDNILAGRCQNSARF